MTTKGFDRHVRIPWTQSAGSCFGDIDILSYIESKLERGT